MPVVPFVTIIPQDKLELANELFDQLDITYEEYYRAVYRGAVILRVDAVLSQDGMISGAYQIAEIVKEILTLIT